MATPKTFTKQVINTTSDQDALQIKDVKGDILSWIDSSGTGQGNLASGGGGGTPGGANTQVQFNNTGAFGGSAELTFSNHLLSINTSAWLDISGTGQLSPGGGDGSNVLLYLDSDSVVGPYNAQFHVTGRPSTRFGFIVQQPSDILEIGATDSTFYPLIQFDPINKVITVNPTSSGTIALSGTLTSNANYIAPTAPVINFGTSGTGDVGLKRVSAGILSITNGSSGSGTLQAGNTILTAAAPTVGASQVGLGSTTATSATAGSNGDVPAQVLGYLIANVAGTTVKIPYYNN